MKLLETFESYAVRLIESLHIPKLPVSAREFIVRHVWWATIVFAVFTGFAVLGSLPALFISGGLFGLSVFAPVLSPLIFVGVIVSAVVLAFNLAQFVLYIMAVSPLKERQLRGWYYLLAVMALEVVGLALSLAVSLLNLEIFSFLFAAIFGTAFTLFGLYLLVEIRSHFMQVSHSAGSKKQ